MGQNWQFDPEKKDYPLVNGAPVSTNRILEKAYFILAIPQGNWIYGAAGQGSKLWQLKNIKRASNLEQRYAGIVNEAIQTQLIDTGQATAVDTTNVQATRDASSNNTNITPSAANVSTGLNFTPI